MAKRGDENFELPFWGDLGKRFYEKVNRLARKYQIPRAQILEEALALYEKSKKALPIKKSAGTEDAVRKVFGSYSKSWWDSLTPEQRKDEAKKRSAAAKVRWSKKT